MSSRPIAQYNIVKFLISLLLSCFVVFMPWPEIRSFPFVDIVNYVVRYNLIIENGFGFDFIQTGAIREYVFAEVSWAYFLYLAGKFSIPPYLALHTVSFLCCFLISWFTVSRVKNLAYVLLLLNPLLIDLVLSQQRSALAFVIMLVAIACYQRHKVIFLFLFCAAFSVHMSSLILFSFLTLAMLFNRTRCHENENVNTLIIFLAILVGALVVVGGQDAVLALLGDRRAYGSAGSQSLLYSSVWGALLVLFIAFSKQEKNGLFYFTISLLSLFVISTLFSTYSSRYLAFAFPFILISLSDLRSEIRLPFMGIILTYVLLQWSLWLQLFS
ncbi:hypothetical protein F0237_16790 [Vibrio tubiashii]|uniref:EpsG family protein n=1 Tax=Vibrio tubiashii TaxID=29498 RepID=A0AAE5GSE9_9VIBR|nr:EpsG family protein [Vibrio tubiashii]NOI82327.1 hypothetical protein [Vibrio tubiashii]